MNGFECLQRLVACVQYIFRYHSQGFAGRSQLNSAALEAAKQFDLEALLELLDLPAQRWLARVQGFGGGSEAPMFDDCEEIFEMTKFCFVVHAVLLSKAAAREARTS